MSKKAYMTYKERQEERRIEDALNDYHDMLADDLSRYPTEEEIPNFLKIRIQNDLYAEMRKKSIHCRVKHIGNIAAVVLLVTLLSAAILCMTVSGIREPMLNFILEHTGYMAVDLPGGKIYVYQNNIEAIDYIGSIIGDGTETSIWKNTAGDEITVLRQDRDAMKVMDTENATVNETVKINTDISGRYIEKLDDDGNPVHALYFYDDVYGYQITSDCSREDLIQVAQLVC